MKTSVTAKWILVVTLVGMLGFGALAMAGQGRGPGYGSGGGYCGECPRGGGYDGERGPRWARDLTPEQRTELETQRKAFKDATQDLRQSIYQKKLELRSEVAKKTPDMEKALSLQDEISNLKAEMARKRLEHRIKVKEIDPELGNFMMGKEGGRKKGRGGYGGCPRW